MPYFPNRRVTIIAQDPSVRFNGKILRERIEIPNEELLPGPRGYRVQVIDYDSTTRTLYEAMPDPPNRDDGFPEDPFERASDDELLESPGFHAMNVYAIIMRTLARFEYALGRRVSWSFNGHQLQVAPHAFADANAFYSPYDQALLFGYFPKFDNSGMVFGCLAHDIVAHETTHALVDGLRERYTDPSSPDQAAFHEGFSDIVAILSVFSLPEVVRVILSDGATRDQIPVERVSVEALRRSLLTRLAEQFGQELSGIRGDALRHSASLPPRKDYLARAEFQESHRRGEVFVAAVLNAFLNVWTRRLEEIRTPGARTVHARRAVEEGSDVADRLLTICIRALDYCPPTDLQFGDYLSALLTADWEMYPQDDKYEFRRRLRDSFAAYGIEAASKEGSEPGAWGAPDTRFAYDFTHFEALQRDPDEAFRFIWQNRDAFRLHREAYTRVLSVRPCVRVGADGFFLRETIVEYLQRIELKARELAALHIRKPDGMPDSLKVTLYGGNAVVFDQHGLVKYNIGKGIANADLQSARLQSLWESGFFSQASASRQPFAAMHRQRSLAWGRTADAAEAVAWTAANQ